MSAQVVSLRSRRVPEHPMDRLRALEEEAAALHAQGQRIGVRLREIGEERKAIEARWVLPPVEGA